MYLYLPSMTMWPDGTSIIILVLLLPLAVIVVVEGDEMRKGVAQNAMTGSPSSPWLKRARNPRVIGCWNRPWICNEGLGFPPMIKRLCCKNRCVDVSSDVNNCGLCGIRCPFPWQCCNGFCIDTNINPFHCGNCLNRCPLGSLCFYGMCGYAQPLPPFPFPLPPKLPLPPFPPKPPKPHPPFPPKG
ncbi:hypothetical protein HHK36_005685 [Tetracentron sinense]|uniref:Stigma-specific Stig1 family protein n=1 Tax=Tetracentron sinense TaxID=13715 RepID=A0A835DR94_TETSI|nr:hypothetical protein HHK36_005685 [Tetracentron sinense]